ncbi:uncharacterized protein LOC120430413 [Culex pipiens pallens]|nr:uncharacterized protein LOC120430413 [Culex pipiens pallens]
MVLFEDGDSKALSKDVIVIGDKDTLPIVGHAVNAFTGGDTGFVDEVKRNETTNEVSYVVRIGEGTVEVIASNLYLNEEQIINWTCKATEGGADDPMQSPSASATNTSILQTPDEASAAGGGEKNSRSTQSKRSNKIQVRDIPR